MAKDTNIKFIDCNTNISGLNLCQHALLQYIYDVVLIIKKWPVESIVYFYDHILDVNLHDNIMIVVEYYYNNHSLVFTFLQWLGKSLSNREPRVYHRPGFKNHRVLRTRH